VLKSIGKQSGKSGESALKKKKRKAMTTDRLTGDRQIDGRTSYRYIESAPHLACYAGSVNNLRHYPLYEPRSQLQPFERLG